MYSPALAAVRLASTVDWKLLTPPKSASVDQLMVDMSLSTFGVWPDLSVQTALGAEANWYVRSVTPGSWGGRSWAAATPLNAPAAPTSVTATAPTRLLHDADKRVPP